MTTHAQADDFDIGKEIFDKLKDLPPERQQRVLRWVSEGLGVVPSTQHQQPALVQPLPQPVNILTSGGGSGVDIKTFISAKAPKSDQQFAATVAYYYRFESPPAGRRDSIDSDLLQEATRLAGRNRLNNPLNTLNNAKKAGYLDSSSPGVFAINTVGENLVAMTLPGGGETSAKQAKKKAKTKKDKTKKATPR